MEPRRSSRAKNSKTALELLGKSTPKKSPTPKEKPIQDGSAEDTNLTFEHTTHMLDTVEDAAAKTMDGSGDNNVGRQIPEQKPIDDSRKDQKDSTSDFSENKHKSYSNHRKQVKMSALKSQVEPGEITDFQSTLEPGEINYSLEPREITGFPDDCPTVSTACKVTDSESSAKSASQHKLTTDQPEQIIYVRSDDGKMLGAHSDSHVAFNALVQLASEAVEKGKPNENVSINKNQSSLVTGKTTEKEYKQEERRDYDEETEDGEICMDYESDSERVYDNIDSKSSNESQRSGNVYEDDTLHRVAMKLINRNQTATSRELIEELDEMGEIDPITDLEINSQERSHRSGRCRPVKQIVMSKELQEMMNKISSKDNFEEHVIIEWGDACASGRRKTLKCRYCDKIILHKHDFRKHIKTHPEVDYKPFTCPICGYKAQIKAQIVRHVNIHSDIKPYMCTECGKRFNFKQKLQLHMKYHMDIRDQLCPLCPLGFHEQKTLKNHLIKIHSISTIKTFMQIWSERKAQTKDPRVDMSDYKGLNVKENQIVHLLKYEDDQKINIISQADNVDSTYSEYSTETHTTGNNEGDTVMTEVILESEAVVKEDPQHLVVVESEASVNPNMIKKPPIDEMCNENKDIQQILVADDGSVSIAIPAKAFISQMGMEDEEYVMNPFEDTQTKKRSMVYGCRKTKLQTHRFKLGLLPPESKAPKDKTDVKDSNILEGKSVKRKLTKHSFSGKGKRFVNNQRCVREDQVDTNLLEYCTVENPVSSKKESDKDAEIPKIKFYCKLCEEYGVCFPSKSQFIEHLEETHRDVKAWKCHLCQYSCRLRTTLAVHLKVHTGIKEHHCHMCGRDFYFKQKLNAHLRHHANIRPHRCMDCNKAFTEKNDLTKHMRRVHDQSSPSPCEICGKEFKERSQLKRHLNAHAGEKAFLCTYCQKYYRSKMSLNQHMKSHTCMFHCEICDRNFGSYSGFMAHKVMHDESYEGYVCELCNAVLHTKGSLNRHKKVAHSEMRPFLCGVCNKGFKAKKDLKNHEIVHMSTKQYVCSVCSFSCKRMESLRVHMRRHSEIKPYQCGVCGKEYTQKFSLETHLKRHTGHVEGICSVCKKSFLTKYQLEQHMKRKHGMEKGADGEEVEPMTVFMCEECNAVFLTQDTLAVHILAEHMKQGFAGGPPLGVVSNNVKSEDGPSVEAPEAETVVEVVADGGNVNAKEAEDSTGYEIETVERIVSISDPNSADGERFVTLVEPVQQGEPLHQSSALIQDMRSDIDSHTLSMVPEGEILSGKHFEKIQPGSFEDKDAANKIDSGYGENTFTTFQQNTEDTFVTIRDPNTNEEYTVSMAANTIGNLLTAADGVDSLSQDQDGNQPCIVVAETIEIPVHENTYTSDTTVTQNDNN